MSRPVTVLLAAVALAFSGLLVIAGWSQASIHYYLPSRTGAATSHRAIFAPGVVATAVAGVVSLLAALWLVLAAAGRSRTWMALAALGLLLVDVLLIVLVSGLDRPSF